MFYFKRDELCFFHQGKSGKGTNKKNPILLVFFLSAVFFLGHMTVSAQTPEATTEATVAGTTAVTKQTGDKNPPKTNKGNEKQTEKETNTTQNYLDKLIASLNKDILWNFIVLSLIVGAGALGGWASQSLTTDASHPDKLPHILTGITAALGICWIISPEDWMKLLAVSALAGYGGKAILDALSTKLQLTVTQQENANLKEKGKKAKQALTDVVGSAAKVSSEHRNVVNAEAKRGGQAAAPSSPTLDDLDQKLTTAKKSLDDLGDTFN